MLELEAEWLGSGADAVTMMMIQWRCVVVVLRWCPTAEAYRLHRESQPFLVVMIIISIITLVTCKELAKSLS